ncbi:Pentatricopeptide repeat-containing protein, chloroplastic [Symbiodinium microadriaticum]|uniref:Pentatricopeptide repeat-containing protein, chloroplastic n=1 Tax=Symbiodinium microadriaticum TaxID=2951 RepID=A0A1Q9CCA4_SYMMI|nr:Pentatricopeptide repeat-containing protein, chloroplastic [Symbiodinium microadriaticum]
MFRTAKAVFALSEVERRDEAVADCKQLVWRFFVQHQYREECVCSYGAVGRTAAPHLRRNRASNAWHAWQSIAAHPCICPEVSHLKEMGLAGELIWFTKQISASGWQSAWTRSSQLFLGTQQVALQPDVVLLGAVSGAFSHGRRWQEAVQLVAGLRCFAVQANQVLHGAIVAACREQWPRAFCVLQEMSEVNVGASTVAAGPAVHASPWVHGLDLFGDLRGRLCEINAVCWNSIIASSGASWPKALNLVDVSKQDAAETNLVALTAAFIVTSAWRASTGLTEQWDAPAYGAAFTKLGAFGEWARPLALLQQASEGRVHLEQPQSAAAVGACSRSSAWRRSLNILLRRSRSYARPVDNVAVGLAGASSLQSR